MFFSNPLTFLTALADLIYPVYEQPGGLGVWVKASHCSLIIQEELDLTVFYANEMQKPLSWDTSGDVLIWVSLESPGGL